MFDSSDFDAFCSSFYSCDISTTSDLLRSLGLESEASSDEFSDLLEPSWCGAAHDVWIDFYDEFVSIEDDI